jgi:hypothetical protein
MTVTLYQAKRLCNGKHSNLLVKFQSYETSIVNTVPDP